MAFQTGRAGSKFVVDFGAIPIPSALATELEGDIQQVALSALARIDFHGDLRIGRLPTGTYGYIFEPDGFPPPPDDGGQPQLSVRDHTEIMRILLERPLPVARRFIAGRQGDGKPPKPPWEQVLQAIMELLGPPATTRRAIEAALQFGKIIEGQALPDATKTAVEAVNRQIDLAGSVDELLVTVQRLRRADDGAVDGLGTGLEIAQQILEDGRGTIYSPDSGFYQGFDTPTTIAASVGKEDAKGVVGGAAGGAVAGSLAGGAGAGPGAVAGAVAGGLAASTAEAVGELLDWLF